MCALHRYGLVSGIRHLLTRRELVWTDKRGDKYACVETAVILMASMLGEQGCAPPSSSLERIEVSESLCFSRLRVLRFGMWRMPTAGME